MAKLEVSSALLNSALVKHVARRPEVEEYWSRNANAGRSALQADPHVRKTAVRSDIASSKGRRRMWGGRALLIPARIAAEFTEAQRAALSVILSAIKTSGTCDWPVTKIAALAGVCRRVVQMTVRKCRELGLLAVGYRRNRRNPLRSFTNLVGVKCKELKAHLRRFTVKNTSPLGFVATVRTAMRPALDHLYKRQIESPCGESVGFRRKEKDAWGSLTFRSDDAYD